MSEEELNKKMEFIVEQQAKFAAEIEIMREIHAVDSKLLKDGLIGLVDIVGHLARTQMRAEETVAAAQAKTDESITRLTEAGARTDERLNNLINIVERHISGNGGPHRHAP
jgi:hypothetical protein